MSILNETFFEQHVAEFLANSRLYEQRSASNFDIDALCDRDMLRNFVQSESDKWSRLVQRFGSEDAAFDAVLKKKEE